MLACSIMLYKSSGAFKRVRLCRVSLQWSRNKGKVEWLSSRSVTCFKHRYTRLDLSNRVKWALYKVFKRTRLCRVYKSNVVWYTKSSAFEQAFTFPYLVLQAQYVFCYNIVQRYLDSFNEYANFNWNLCNWSTFAPFTSWFYWAMCIDKIFFVNAHFYLTVCKLQTRWRFLNE